MAKKTIDKTKRPDPQESVEQDDAVIGTAFRWSLAAIIVGLVIGGGAIYWFNRPKPAAPTQQTELASVAVRQVATVQPPDLKFTDVTKAAGIEFVHNRGATGAKLLPETMGGGVAVFDFDDDGDQDILFLNSKNWPWDAPLPDQSQQLALYRNDDGKFTDVTQGSGLDVSIYAMGAAVGDYDNDGRVDVFVSAVGANHLFHNLGDGKFADVSESSKTAGEETDWSSGCGWFDFDNDGDLDLFVCNYVRWNKEYDLAQNFQLVGGGRAYGRPQNFEGTFPYLYRNDGDGVFTDITAQAGLQVKNPLTNVPLAKSLGLTFCDIDEDGWIDILVANDTVQNLIFKNTGKGTFLEFGVPAGIAFDPSGNARGAMGIDVAAIRGSDSMGIAIGNFANEMTAMYVSRRGQMQFTDEAISTGLGPNTRLQLTFGVCYLDYDLDGRLDLMCANGHLEEDINRVQPSQHYAQPPQLFWNAGPLSDTEFVAVDPAHCGEDLVAPMVGRAVAYLDYDRDGDQDVLVTAVGGAPRLLRNDQQLGRHGLRVRLVGDGKQINRDAIGSWVEVTAGDKTYRQQVMPTRSYLTQVELPLTFGLGDAKQIDSLEVQWSDGTKSVLHDVKVDQLQTIRYAPQE
ncbi:ASPIC and UnbV [Rosistilla oblonga]|uniref:CRTAC1 family protein n=1 Tax=Rosistilla oblonga TaxID=2527990 RepID=UPI00118D30E7|nr:CRTAC1 family protein [Rosistilla oblonga]QDV10177.1 ASPIC and UnbV [Rosistilla oblonga]